MSSELSESGLLSGFFGRVIILDSGLQLVSKADDECRDVEKNCPDEIAGIAIDVAVVTNGGCCSSRLALVTLAFLQTSNLSLSLSLFPIAFTQKR